MKFSSPLISATLIKRYKRFLADVRLADGSEITVHCPNTGAMTGCGAPGDRVWLSDSGNPKRKYRHTWELTETGTGDFVGVNTHRGNALVKEAIQDGVIRELQGYSRLRGEVKYGAGRIDLLLEADDKPPCYVEVKNVTLRDKDGSGLFPDAVSQRGTRQLGELSMRVQAGDRALVCYCVQHSGIRCVQPAVAIDPIYATALREAVNSGLEVLAYGAELSPQAVTLRRRLPFTFFD